MPIMPINPTPTMMRPKVKYVDVRFAISEGETAGQVVGYLVRPLQTVEEGSVSSVSSVGSTTIMAHGQPSYTFVPLAPNDEKETTSANMFSPPASPFDFRKIAASPALTATTMDTSISEFSFRLDSRAGSSLSGGFISPISPPPTIQQSKVCLPVTPRSELIRTPTPIPRKIPEQPKKKSAFFARVDDPVRKSKLKTELCKFFEKGVPCPYEGDCDFAHGEEELQMTKLMDLHRVGLIDVETYRTKPCLTWVTTGSCPFGLRCANLHDKRVAGDRAAWLPVTETQGNTISTDINVESMHQKRLYSILYDNPFGNQFSLEFDDWESLYKLVCNMTETTKHRRRRCSISAMHKIDIALKMQGRPDWHYKFSPHHIIHNELCMVLQKRVFKLTNSGEAVEIPVTSYNPRSPIQVVVREIAFGPEGDPVARNVALWFNIDEKDVADYSLQNAKRYRWKRGPHSNKRKEQPNTSSAFDYLECFLMVRPHDVDAHHLTTRILKHRLGVLRAEHVSTSMRGRSEKLKCLEVEKLELKKLIEYQIDHWKRWAWPINEGRDLVDDDTPVPRVDGYYFEDPDKMQRDMESKRKTSVSVTGKIWKSFVSCNFAEDLDAPTSVFKNERSNRLSIFRRLALREKISPTRNLPHILNGKKLCNVAVSKKASERGWRSLLLHEDGCNEWAEVIEHFEKSRSKKVLRIVQQ